MNNYYLIAFDSEPKIIELIFKNNDKEIHTKSSTLQDIDKLTILYSMEQIKNKLIKNGKISSMDTEILVLHQTKYKGKVNIKAYPVLTENNYLKPSDELRVYDIESLIKKLNNGMKNDEFKSFVDYYYSDIDEHTLSKFKRIFGTMFKNSKVKEEEIPYIEARKVLNTIIYYNRFKTIKEYDDYFFKINRYIHDHFDQLFRMTDPNNIEGQMSFVFDNGNLFYITDNKVERVEPEIESEELDYYDLYYKIQNEPFDNPECKKWLDNNSFPSNAYQMMTLGDRIRTRFITPFEFRDILYKGKGKTK